MALSDEPDGSSESDLNRRAIVGRSLSGNHRENDVVLVLLELKNELDAFEFVEDAKVDGRRRTEEIHGFSS
jgi:hypothetical protein